MVAPLDWSVRVASSNWLSLGAHVGLEISVGLGACRGGEVSQVRHQVVLVERSGELR